jgi:hypothetical protein
MTQHPMHPGRPTQPMVSMSAQPPTTTDASNSTSHPCDASGSPTHGACIQPTARSLSLHNTISPLLLQQTSSRHLGTLYLQRQRKKIKHIRAIQNLTAIMTGQREAPEEPPSPRVVASTARVVSAPPSRVLLHQTISQHPMSSEPCRSSTSATLTTTTLSTS